MTGQPRKIHFNAGRKKNIERVLRFQAGGAGYNLNQMFSFADDPFREQKPGGKFAVVTGRAHRHRHAATAHTDFQRFFNGEMIRFCPRFPPFDKTDNADFACLPIF